MVSVADLGAQPSSLSGPIEKRLEKDLGAVMAARPLRSKMAIQLYSLRDGRVLYAKHAQEAMIPASVTKLVTSLAALHEYGPQYQFSTPVHYSGTRRGSLIEGDLQIRGTGDPYLTSEALWNAAHDLRHLGLRRVSGDLVIDQSLFLSEKLDRLEGETDSQNAYDAPISAFGVNFNTVEIAIAPAPAEGKGAGKLALVNQFPYGITDLKIGSQVSLKEGSTGASLRVERVSPKGGGREAILATGWLGSGSGLRKVYRSVHDPNWVSGEIFRAFLAHAGIEVSGRVRTMTASDVFGQKLLDIRGNSLDRVVQGLNYYSNNYMADVLTKDLGVRFAEKQGKALAGSGSFANGVAYLEQFLRQQVGLKGSFVLDNGSGLSQKNRFSVQQISQLLAYAYQNMRLMPEFMASLAVAGETGTLARRFKDYPDLRGRVRAKTGTLSVPFSVAGLAGYFESASMGPIAFAILENGVAPGSPDLLSLRNRQDAMIAKAMQVLQ
jgi:D-alanyl-D-alanine carboxypeptidase/D-alanyl-D-alanine-endopeptidase (penicillin-binding protein 4)